MLIGQKYSLSTKLSDNKDDDFDIHKDSEQGILVEESKPELKEPPIYQVVLLNDDYTPMDFVVRVLLGFFSKNQIQATQIMLQVHHQGKGICGKYTHEVAETKVMQVNNFSREHAHPLIAELEKVND